MSRERRELNGYLRTSSPKAVWEQQYTLGETTGLYDEEYQAEKRLAEHGEEYAEWYRAFNERYYKYKSSADTDWGKDLRNSRRKDLYVTSWRVSENAKQATPTNVIQFPVLKRGSKTYTESDYQRHMAYNSNFTDYINDQIDRERGLDKAPESGTPGIIYLPQGRAKLGFGPYDSRGGWIVSIKIDGEYEREYFQSLLAAELYRTRRLEEAGLDL